MYRMTVRVEGMMCARCEDTVADRIRADFRADRVKASRRKKQVVIETKAPLDGNAVIASITEAGYEPVDAHTEEAAERKFRLFGK